MSRRNLIILLVLAAGIVGFAVWSGLDAGRREQSPEKRETQLFRAAMQQIASSTEEPPAPGTYTYEVKLSNPLGENTANGKTFISHEKRTEGSHDVLLREELEGTTIKWTLGWQNDGITLIKREATFEGGSRICEYQAPAYSIRFPIAVGDTWQIVAACDDTPSTTDRTVLRRERLELGGVAFDTFAIRSTQEADEQTSWFSPRHRIWVQKSFKTPTSDGGAATTDERLISYSRN